MAPQIEIGPGHIFWFDSGGDTIGQEEKGNHPWIVISSGYFHRKTKLVLAVPCTSSPMEYAFDVAIGSSAIRPWPQAKRKLSTSDDTMSKVAKPRKIRHISIDRIDEIVGQVVDSDVLYALKRDLIGALLR